MAITHYLEIYFIFHFLPFTFYLIVNNSFDHFLNHMNLRLMIISIALIFYFLFFLLTFLSFVLLLEIGLCFGLRLILMMISFRSLLGAFLFFFGLCICRMGLLLDLRIIPRIWFSSLMENLLLNLNLESLLFLSNNLVILFLLLGKN